MTNYSILGRNLKRGIFKFCGKISKGFYRPAQKFILDMIYGLVSGKSCYLTEIARKLKEDDHHERNGNRETQKRER